MHFIKSKKIGDFVEQSILKRVQEKFPNAYIDDRYKPFSWWDIYVPEKKYGIEVKLDRQINQTKKILIEVEMNNKLSALSVTRAKWWVIIDGVRIIWVNPLEIYKFIELNLRYKTKHIELKYFTGKGDNTSKYAYLIDYEVFVKYVNSLENECGFIKMIDESDELHINNLREKFDLE